MKNLNEFGVHEVRQEEMVSVNGGAIGIGAAILIGCAIATFTEVIGDWDNFERGFTGKPCKQ